jgi:hypothetical protein
MYDSTYIVLYCFAHLLLQHPCISYVEPSRFILPVSDTVYTSVQLDRVSHLRDIHAALLYPCAAHVISVDTFHDSHSSLCDNPCMSLDTSCIPVFLVPSLMHMSNYTLYKMLKSVFRSLYVFLQCDFSTFFCLLYRDLFVHAALMHCIPQEDPACIVYFILLLMMRSMILRHDFLACVTDFYAKQLNFRSMILRHDFLARITTFYDRQLTFRGNVHHRPYNAGGPSRLGLVDLARFSLPCLFIVIQFASILMYRCPSWACFSSKGIGTPSASSSFSCDDQPLSHRVLTYGGGRQHVFSALAVDPYITAGHKSCSNSAFKFVDHIDGVGQLAYPIAQKFIHTNIPLCDIIPHLSIRVALKIARLHHLQIGSHVSKSEICRIFEGHNCISCNLFVTVFAVVDTTGRRVIHKAEKPSENGVTSHAIDTGMPVKHKFVKPKSRGEKKLDSGPSHHDVVFSKLPDTTPFPPAPVNNELSRKIIHDFCVDSFHYQV